jgi:hypothetical protein
MIEGYIPHHDIIAAPVSLVRRPLMAACGMSIGWRAIPRTSLLKPDIMMVMDEKDHRVAVGDKSAQGLMGDAVSLPLRLFRHRDLLSATRAATVIKQKDLINTLHHVHFTNGSILVHVNDPKYSEDFLIRCRLESCMAKEIRCLWPEDVSTVSDKGHLLHLIVEDGLSLLFFPIQVTELDEKGFSVALPEVGRLLGKRKIRRHGCRDVIADLMQSGFSAEGALIDFTPLAFRIRFPPSPKASFIWINIDEPFMLCLRKGERIIFSESCRCIRQVDDTRVRELVLAPLGREIQRFRKKKTRTPRLRVTPPPLAYFTHPFFTQCFQRDILDLTFTGFVVEEKSEECVLMPGMIIHGLELRYAEALKMSCDAQVIYRREMKKGRVRCGLAILNMDFRTYRNLSHIMVHAGDPQARFNSDVEMEALWKFLFDSNFIYPKKYHLLQSYREEFKETYRRLCSNDQEVEAHFTYQENGRIYGHASILRAYQRTWMWHHLAATPLNGRRTGRRVLKNIHRFCDGLCRYPSSLMDYMIAYFRPDNYIPNLLFGGFARELGNPRACSMDLFAYLSHPTRGPQVPFPQGWQLTEFEKQHFPEFERYYRNSSGGLLLDVLRFGQTDEGEEPVEEVYRRHGLVRQCSLYALIKHQELKAVFIVNHSSPGLNLSEFLNCIKVVIIDPADLPREALTAALARLTVEYPTENVPILIYPANYPSGQGLDTLTRYNCWIIDTQYAREYLEYMEQKTKITPRSLILHFMRKLMQFL